MIVQSNTSDHGWHGNYRRPTTFKSDTAKLHRTIFTRATLAIAWVLDVIVTRASVCLSKVGVLIKRLNVGSRKERHTIAEGF